MPFDAMFSTAPTQMWSRRLSLEPCVSVIAGIDGIDHVQVETTSVAELKAYHRSYNILLPVQDSRERHMRYLGMRTWTCAQSIIQTDSITASCR